MRRVTTPGRPSTSTRRSARILWALLLAVTLQLQVTGSPAGAASTATEAEQPGPVYVVDISGTIDLGLAPYLDRVLGEAERAGAVAVVVEIDTPGGRLDAVLQMRDALLDTPLRTIALVDSTAFSAGALVAIACREIYLTPGAVMGAATPVLGGTGEVADEKTISAVRSTFEATAEERGRDPRVASAMVDPEVEVEGLIEQGRLLTLTVSQALDAGYAEGVVANLAGLLDELGFADREVVHTSPSLAERLVRVVTNPIVASLLLILGVLLLLGDLASGGVGIGLLAGLGLLTLFFWGHMLAGLAGWEDVALVVVGLGLLAVEAFLVPGFGVPGVLGLLALLGGAFLAMLYRDFDFVTTGDLQRAAITVGVAFVAIALGTLALLVALARGTARNPLVLQARLGVTAPVTQRSSGGWLRWFDTDARLDSDGAGGDGAGGDGEPPAAPPEADLAAPSLVGASGTALTDLRPAGIADIDGRRVDVVTEGEYLRRGDPVEVMRDDRYRRVVRRRDP